MKSKVSIILVVGFVASLFSLTALAQAEEMKPQLFVVWDVIVHPSKFMEFEAANKEFVGLMAKYECPFPMTTYRTNDFHYYFLIPIENLAGLEKIVAYFDKIAEKAKKEYEAIDKSMAGTFESETVGIVALRTDLSYIPEKPSAKLEDMNFVWWNFYFIKSWKGKEAEEIAKEWQALWGSKKISYNFNVYQYYLGPDMPVLVAAGGAKSEAAYYSDMEKNIEMMGDEYAALTKKTMDVCRKFEQRTGTILRELTYIPPKK
jgi:hypothetical protein